MTNLGPPWIIFSDKGKPVAILPAGRPGEVANVEGLTMAEAQAIVNAANNVTQTAVEMKLNLLTTALQIGVKQARTKNTLQAALDLLEGYEWHFEDRGGAGEWNVCQVCWAEYPVSTTNGAHKPECQWASTVAELRELLR